MAVRLRGFFRRPMRETLPLVSRPSRRSSCRRETQLSWSSPRQQALVRTRRHSDKTTRTRLEPSISPCAANSCRLSKPHPSKPSMSTILDVQRLTKTYKTGAGALTVLKEISFTLPQGSTCSILGPSGSGKTTLLGLCAGLDRPSSGSVLLNGEPLADMDEDQRARARNEHVGFVFQNFQLIPTLTALENVTVPMELRGDRSARTLGLDLLGRVGLRDRLDHYPAQLSGGEQQRVALARAFINRPKILFADEPTGNLDAETSAGIIEIMFELNRSAGTALVLVTHDQDVAKLTERTIRLRNGEAV